MADQRLVEFSVKTQMITETCITCHVLFAMPKDLYDTRQRDKGNFYCPNGHYMAYVGDTEAKKLAKQLDEERRLRQRAEQNVAYEQDRVRRAEEDAEHQRRRANGYKGHATRITKRAKAGVCPCCNRTFKQLAEHMANKHPDFTPECPEPPALVVVNGGKL